MTVTTSRNAGGEFESSIEDMDKGREAAELRATGLSYREIGARQGVSGPTAYRRVKAALAAVPVEAVNELRTVEGSRLDILIRRAMLLVLADGGDPNVRLRAIEQVRRLSESRRRLFGIDVPAEVRVTVSDPVVSEIEALAALLEVQDPTRALGIEP